MKPKRLFALFLLVLALPANAGHHGDDDIGTLPRPHSEEEAGWSGAGFDVAPETEELPSGWVLVDSIPIAPATTSDLWVNAYSGALGASTSTIDPAGTLYADEATPSTVPTMRTSWKTTMPNGGVIVTSTTTGQWGKAHKLAVDEAMKWYPPDPPA